MSRPYVLVSCAMSVDGYIDDSSDRRLILSNNEDLDRVDDVRAGMDAILVGARTLRADNPRLLVRSTRRRHLRTAEGLRPDPLKVTVSGSGDLDPTALFFTTGDQEKLVYCPDDAAAAAEERVGGRATVLRTGASLDLDTMLGDLTSRGVRRLMVEGGSVLITQFLTRDLVDEIHLVVAPFFIGDPGAPRFVGPGAFPNRRMEVVETRGMGDCVLIRYLCHSR